MKAKVQKTEKHALGTIMNPHMIPAGALARFEYGDGNYFEARLEVDGSLTIRIGGTHGDILATHHEVANVCHIVARRWSDELGRHVEFVHSKSRRAR